MPFLLGFKPVWAYSKNPPLIIRVCLMERLRCRIVERVVSYGWKDKSNDYVMDIFAIYNNYILKRDNKKNVVY